MLGAAYARHERLCRPRALGDLRRIFIFSVFFLFGIGSRLRDAAHVITSDAVGESRLLEEASERMLPCRDVVDVRYEQTRPPICLSLHRQLCHLPGQPCGHLGTLEVGFGQEDFDGWIFTTEKSR